MGAKYEIVVTISLAAPDLLDQFPAFLLGEAVAENERAEMLAGNLGPCEGVFRGGDILDGGAFDAEGRELQVLDGEFAEVLADDE